MVMGDEASAAGGGPGKPGPLPFDTSKAHQARVYDYVLGGKDNYEADRAATEAWLKIDPGMAFTARANRAFLGRAVRYLAAEAGIRQFLDIGTGIPAAGNTPGGAHDGGEDPGRPAGAPGVAGAVWPRGARAPAGGILQIHPPGLRRDRLG